MLQPLDLPGADVGFDAEWLSAAEADALFDSLHGGLSWETHRIRLFGREVDSPRRSVWIGDTEAVYRYSGTRFVPRPWTPELRALASRLGTVTGARFNSVLANLYRDGRDGMGWHSDDEPELGPRPVIASLSLGAPRRFVFKARTGDARRALTLPHGSLLLMAGDTQRLYRHALPKTARTVAPRINLTFRCVLPRG
ncbi:alpha-ketoglutarate-dependent dioxygenase AlkB [Luteimonas yindakuii]|uniref:Alpha-ketoglutarate-dependent dioxygenase AlkB n=1 Tax=Luteimonas yindakuii TaxID=2565782 RepID=A0A4Z1QZU8_9GAMM|nr:alpha-ketoglutarate-dependent dioxygenase AlkB [Luteimonas yindakuii]TKS52782.1 alpha-ketoglutarate-dependent dioxygenase AlkB [Luteimonas yindakuii]